MSAAVRGSLFLGGLPPQELARVLERARLKRFARGRVIWRSDDDRVLVVLGGIASAVTSTLDGQQVILELLGVGDAWGVSTACDGSGPRSAIEVVASGEVSALMIRGHDLRALAQERPALALACLATVSAALVGTREEAVRFANTSTAERIVHRLLELADRWGELDPREPRRVRIRRSITQEELGSWAHSSRESASKALRDLRLAGIVETRRRELVILDMPRLQERLTGAPQEVDSDWFVHAAR